PRGGGGRAAARDQIGPAGGGRGGRGGGRIRGGRQRAEAGRAGTRVSESSCGGGGEAGAGRRVLAGWDAAGGGWGRPGGAHLLGGDGGGLRDIPGPPGFCEGHYVRRNRSSPVWG